MRRICRVVARANAVGRQRNRSEYTSLEHLTALHSTCFSSEAVGLKVLQNKVLQEHTLVPSTATLTRSGQGWEKLTRLPVTFTSKYAKHQPWGVSVSLHCCGRKGNGDDLFHHAHLWAAVVPSVLTQFLSINANVPSSMNYKRKK